MVYFVETRGLGNVIGIGKVGDKVILYIKIYKFKVIIIIITDLHYHKVVKIMSLFFGKAPTY